MLTLTEYRAMNRALHRARASLAVQLDQTGSALVREWLTADLAEAEAALRALERVPVDLSERRAERAA